MYNTGSSYLITDNGPIIKDIALLKLERPAQLSQYVNVACLAEEDNFHPGSICTAVGWGQLGQCMYCSLHAPIL